MANLYFRFLFASKILLRKGRFVKGKKSVRYPLTIWGQDCMPWNRA